MKSEEYFNVLSPRIIQDFQNHICYKFFITTLSERIDLLRDKLEAGRVIIKSKGEQEVHHFSMEELKYFQGGVDGRSNIWYLISNICSHIKRIRIVLG